MDTILAMQTCTNNQKIPSQQYVLASLNNLQKEEKYDRKADRYSHLTMLSVLRLYTNKYKTQKIHAPAKQMITSNPDP
jgi:hypothetical protein